MKTFLQFVLAMVISFIPGAIGVMFTPSGVSDIWYNALERSVLTPDGWVFGVAWTILYAILGVALFLIMRSKTKCSKAGAYWLFVIQMILNALWTYLFFGLQLPFSALLVLIALIGISVWMFVSFLKVSRGAAWLVVPYILWLLFALYLNGTIYLLN